MNKKDLFKPIVDASKLDEGFEYMRTSRVSEPARLMANEIFQDFPDMDGNFVEQFQTTGFDSRIFELYLYAYFSRSGYSVDRAHQQPDFIVTKGGVAVAIEATTVNPTQTEDTVDTRRIADLTVEELREKLENELPIRFGGPLFSKLNKEYWRLEQCRGIPVVLAIEAFQEEGSLYFSHSSLGQYLYGQRHYPDWTEDGHLTIKSRETTDHRWGSKVIPSNFFGQPNAEYVGAVVFSNSGTHAKFSRMGYHAGYYRGNTHGIRRGTCWNPDPDATTPMEFSYEIDDPPVAESWGQGLVVFHNPYALFQVPRGYFVDAAEMYIKDGQIQSDVPHFFPYMSQTLFVSLDRGPFDSAEAQQLPIESLLKHEFDALRPARHVTTPTVAVEKEWFADRQRILLGSLLLDRTDEDWVYVVLGRDQLGTFRWIDGEVSIEDRDEARERLLAKMLKTLESGQRVFPQR